MELTKRDLERLAGVHPDLQRVIREASALADFMVLEGLRSRARQQELVTQGKSQTMFSRHLTGHAVDIAPLRDGTVSWDWPDYHALAPVVKGVAERLGVPIEWGGDWKGFPDGPHWQLPFNAYPLSGA